MIHGFRYGWIIGKGGVEAFFINNDELGILLHVDACRPRRGERTLESAADGGGEHGGRSDEGGDIDAEDLLKQNEHRDHQNSNDNDVLERGGETVPFPPDHEEVAVQIQPEAERSEDENEPGKETQIIGESRGVFRSAPRPRGE